MTSRARSHAFFAAGLAALACAASCTSSSAPERVAEARHAVDEHHPATLEEAKAIAAQRNVPILVDFYSPT